MNFLNGIHQSLKMKEASDIPSPKTQKAPNDKKALKIIKKFLNSDGDEELSEDDLANEDIPKHFKFCFLEDANVDHPTAIEEAANALDPKVAVTGFNIFFNTKFDSDCGANHLGPLLDSFLPDFLRETEEWSFAVHPEFMSIYDEERIDGIKNGSIPHVPYDSLVATLEKAGFTYEIENCMLGKLGGSQCAQPLEVAEPPKGELKFCIVAVKDQSYNALYDRSKNKDCDHITAILVDVDKDRDNKEKLINKSLKKYSCVYPGRIMNGMLPYIELVQLIKKGQGSGKTNNDDRQAIYDALIEL
jgi:hypothetical protein